MLAEMVQAKRGGILESSTLNNHLQHYGLRHKLMPFLPPEMSATTALPWIKQSRTSTEHPLHFCSGTKRHGT
jgi:hypothetical protein